MRSANRVLLLIERFNFPVNEKSHRNDDDDNDDDDDDFD